MSSYLYKLIAEGEHQQQDFKFCINDSKKIAKSLVAFANTDGGRLLIGVKDNGKIAGISSDEEFYMIEAAAKIYSQPPINFTTQQWQVEGKTVLEIGIEASETKPHYAKDENGKWLAYIRIKDENILAHKIQLEVWKKEQSTKGVYFTYSEDERFLIDFLKNNESITFSKFMRKAQLQRKKAEEILSNFVIIDIIKMCTTQNGTHFVLNTEFDRDEIDKFV
ncbi:putative DNA binding domain-containing protein [Draconibacterium sp. IB214405]|uniref:AlbA family DNA-binding domain-containing protein n=1 Tax=Draconibacterium sp. IB214405 TaxID=3097352 RepID=UPI002A1014B5|nr:RNA-binding domain-containing protein [Draconibacterium sp. IB214405]MDX8338570.1 putative DNA binding domain-containing protein [Draconibacterium sp. IB214405]